MIHKDIKTYLNNISNNLSIVNKLVVSAFLQFNNIGVKKNKIILSCIEGNEHNKIQEFIGLIKSTNNKFDFEDLIHLFETTIPSDDVLVNGAVYTPYYIKNFIVDQSLKSVKSDNYSNLKIVDMACGTGAFLYTMAEKIKSKSNKSYFDIFQNNIFGLDICEFTIERAKILLCLLAILNGEDEEEFSFNLVVGNALNFDWNKYYNMDGFDVVVGNPPYVRAKNLSTETKELLKHWEVTKSGNPDLYIPFFEIGLKYLKQNGILGFITVNTFKKSVNARSLREYFKRNLFDISILDFGNSQIFKNKSTYTCMVFIEKKKSNAVKYQKITPKNILSHNIKSFFEIDYNFLDTKKGWMLNDPNILKNINTIESTGKSLGDKFEIKNGIATLCNDIFIFKPIKEDDKYYYHKSNKLYKIEKSICRDIVKPNKLKRESEILSLKEKIIYPYHQDDQQSKPIIYEEDYFQKTFPHTYAYLKDHKGKLLNRDKGKPTKYKWYEFGRTQALTNYGKKLLFPYIAKQPYFVYTDQEDLLLYAGYAIYSESERELKVLKRVLESKVFWFYIKNTSKPYSNDYYALAKNYVKDFGICELTEDEKDLLLNQSLDQQDKFLLKKYNINIENI